MHVLITCFPFQPSPPKVPSPNWSNMLDLDGMFVTISVRSEWHVLVTISASGDRILAAGSDGTTWMPSGGPGLAKGEVHLCRLAAWRD